MPAKAKPRSRRKTPPPKPSRAKGASKQRPAVTGRKAAPAFASPAIRWDLADLYAGMDDPRIEASLAELMGRAETFASRYRGKINSPELTAATLAEALREFESMGQEASKADNFAGLLHATDAANPAVGAFYQRTRERQTQLSVVLLFFELELLAADEAHIARLLADPALANYRHYVTTARTFRRHMLSEPEEKVAEELANTGRRAFERLFEEVTSNHLFPVPPAKAGGKPERLTQSEVLARLRDPDRAVRRRASEGFTGGLRDLQRVLAFTFNTLLQDKATLDRLRRYDAPERARHLSNELDDDTVEVVISTVEKNMELVARYYRVKRRILKLPELTHYDRYAPLFAAKERIGWEEARRIVLNAFEGCSPLMRQTAEEFFPDGAVRRGGWIDAQVRTGKRGGAFCAYITPDLHPYVLVNYLGKMDDVMTLAHELGHGVHASLSRGQTYFNFHGTLPLAELASTFGEMLVFEKLQARATPRDRLALYADKIDGAFATVFRQAVMYRFEQDIHRHRRAKGELTPEEFGDYWQCRIGSMFGDSVKLGADHRLWWSYIPHFIRSPFYVYAYSFGELLALALYQRFTREGPPFAERYLEVLRQGGSLSPQELMGSIGIDLKAPVFWQGGVEVLATMVERFETLYDQLKEEL